MTNPKIAEVVAALDAIEKADNFLYECQECAFGQTDEWKRLKAAIRAAEPAADEFSAEINALPDRLRRFIRDLELRMDPAGDVRRAYIAEMKAEGLAAKLEECLIRLDSTRRTLP